MNTRLKEAAEQGDLKRLVSLLEQGADVNALRNRRDRSALIEASSNGHVQCVHELIKRGADLDYEDAHGMTALTCAMQKGHALCLQTLVLARIKRHGNGNAIRQLIAYAEAGDFGKIRSLVENLEILHKLNDREKNLVMFLLLAFRCPRDILDHVIEVGADVNARIQNVLSPFLYTVIQANTQCLEVLLRHRLDFSSWSSKTPGTYHSPPVTNKSKERKLIDRMFEDKYPNPAMVLKAKTIFMFAAQSADGLCLETLLKFYNHQVDLDEKDSDGLTALMYAAMSPSPACVRVLLDNGADADSRCKEGKTPLMYAARSGCVESLTLLLKNGSKSNELNPPEVDREGVSALMHASMCGHWECANLLIRHGASVNSTNKITGHTVLMFALLGGNVDYVRRLIQEGANVNSVDLFGKSTLIYAVLGRSEDCVREILRHGCQVDHEARDTHTALWWAIKHGQLDMVELLVKEGAQFQDKWMTTSMFQAARIGEHTSVQILITNFKANAAGSCWSGESFLMHAALRGSVETVKLLIDHGANVHERCKKNGKSVLMHAAEGGNADCVRLLLQGGAAIKEVDKSGRTALMLASQGGYVKCVDLMLDQCNVDVNLTDNEERTALTHAVMNGFHVEKCVSALLSSGADANCVDKEGKTPLMYSAQSGDLKSVNMLLEKGADVEAVDKTGRSAVSYAVIYGNKSCFKRITEFRPWCIGNHNRVYLKSIKRVFNLCAPKEMYILIKEGYFRWDWLDNQDWTSVKNASFALVRAGIPPDTFQFRQDGTTLETSVLKFCLHHEDYEMSRFLLDNLYLCNSDMHDLWAIVSQVSAMSWDACDNRLLSHLTNQMPSHPLRLTFLSFLTVSTALRPTTQFGERKTMVDSLPLPQSFKTILTFQSNDSQLAEE